MSSQSGLDTEEKGWYYKFNQETEGPVDEEEILNLYKNGTLNSFTRVKNNTPNSKWNKWTPVAQIPNFKLNSKRTRVPPPPRTQSIDRM